MVQHNSLYFCTVSNSSPACIHRGLILFPVKYEQQPIERSTTRSTERPINRAIHRLLVSNCFFTWQHILTTLNYPMQRANDYAIEQVIPYRPRPLDGLVGYRDAIRITRTWHEYGTPTPFTVLSVTIFAQMAYQCGA